MQELGWNPQKHWLFGLCNKEYYILPLVDCVPMSFLSVNFMINECKCIYLPALIFLESWLWSIYQVHFSQLLAWGVVEKHTDTPTLVPGTGPPNSSDRRYRLHPVSIGGSRMSGTSAACPVADSPEYQAAPRASWKLHIDSPSVSAFREQKIFPG